MILKVTNENGMLDFIEKPTDSISQEVFSRMKQDEKIVEFQFIRYPGMDGENVRYRKVDESTREKAFIAEEKRMYRIHTLHDEQVRKHKEILDKYLERLCSTQLEIGEEEHLKALIRQRVEIIKEFGEDPFTR